MSIFLQQCSSVNGSEGFLALKLPNECSLISYIKALKYKSRSRFGMIRDKIKDFSVMNGACHFFSPFLVFFLRNYVFK